MEFKTLNDLYAKYPWKTLAKFKPLANRYGFTDEQEIKRFLKDQAGHDVYRPQGNQFLPIFSKSTGAYQFDTLIQSRRGGAKPWLIFINVNTRKGYGYEMENKNAASVKIALHKFLHDCPDCKVLTSDQDPAYLSSDVIQFMRDHRIDYRTTETNNHNVLGIINRFMRTLRDLNGSRDFENTNMLDLIREYNDSPHRGINYKAPNEMTKEDVQRYVEKKEKVFNENLDDLAEGQRVRIILDKNKIGKKRSNLSKEAYEITGRKGNQFIVKAKDETVDTFPRYRLVKCDNRYQLADTIKTGVRENIDSHVVERITGYSTKNKKYKVKWEGIETPGEADVKSMRLGRPTEPSAMEKQYWARRQPRTIPKPIRQFLQAQLSQPPASKK